MVVSDEMWKIINESVERPLRSSGSFADSNKYPVVVYGPVKPCIAEAFVPEPVVSDFSPDKVATVDAVGDAGVDNAKRQVKASSFCKSPFLTKFGYLDGGLSNKRKRPLLDGLCPFSNAFGENHTQEQYAEFDLWINSGLKKRNKYVYFIFFIFFIFFLFLYELFSYLIFCFEDQKIC